MSDVVVTVPQHLWEDWLDEGDLPGEPWSGEEWHFYLSGAVPRILPGERVYVVAHGRLRGYAPLVRIERGEEPWQFALVRHGGAVAITVPEVIPGFRGWRYRWWDRSLEAPFPAWQEVRASEVRQAGEIRAGQRRLL